VTKEQIDEFIVDLETCGEEQKEEVFEFEL
jgi:hypothetical protein